jgi:catalase
MNNAKNGSDDEGTAQYGDQEVHRARGGETHQWMADGAGNGRLTTAQGVPVSDDQNTLRAGEHGPSLIEDSHFREKIFHFDHERIPERVVHARGYGAHGYFENYAPLTDITKADPFSEAGLRTPVFVRFSTVAGNAGSSDLARDVRGFATKFYTREGNWDLVGNNIPVFFIQDAIKFPDLIHAAKAEPDRGFPQAQTAHDNFWDFASLMPEATHMLMWIMSDRAIPRSLRFMEGFGVHTFRLVNEAGQSTYVKFHWKPKHGLQSVVWNEAVKINGADPDFHRRDLWEAIGSADYPEWELGLQVFDDDFADEFEFDVLDPTKLIPEERVPVRLVGRLVLDRVVDNFFAETEQVAFCTQNVVPGIDFTNDPLLQGRNFSYLDTQLKRLGSPNFAQLPVNAPKCPVANFQQDGHMALLNLAATANPVTRANYEPNSWPGAEGGPREDPSGGYRSYPEQVRGTKRRLRPESFADHYSQARQFYISQTPVERRHIADSFTFELGKVKRADIRTRMVGGLRNVDEELAATVAEGLGLRELPAAADAACETRQDLPASPALSILGNGPRDFAGRKLGILVTNGADAATLAALRAAAAAEGATVEIIAAAIGGVDVSDGTRVPAGQQIDGAPSVLYDVVAILAAPASVPAHADARVLAARPTARDFVTDAVAHCKFIGYTSGAAVLFEAAGLPADPASQDEGFVSLDDHPAAEFIARCRPLRYWQREFASALLSPGGTTLRTRLVRQLPIGV